MKIGALEAGGTKMVMGVYTQEGELIESQSIPTLTPDKTMPVMLAYFKEKDISALGIGSFGPLDLNKHSATYGYITSTPKLAWADYPLLPRFRDELNIPCELDTDVNAAALAESRLGVGKGLDSVVYVTIGTGIGGGAIVGGECVHGLVHPEMGHMLLRPRADDPLPKGVCPYHDGCLEGLASGTAINARCDGKAASLGDDDPLIQLEAHYLGQMCANLVTILSPEKIILGGGVMQRKALLPMVREEAKALLHGYIRSGAIIDHIDDYIVSPALFPISGLAGSYLLGLKALQN